MALYCHFVHRLENAELVFETVSVSRRDMLSMPDTDTYLAPGPNIAINAHALDVYQCGDVFVPCDFSFPKIQGRNGYLLSVCTNEADHIIHAVWLDNACCDARTLVSVFDDYWFRVLDGAEARGLIWKTVVRGRAWDEHITAECVVDDLLDVHYVNYNANLSPRRIHYMGETSDGARSFGCIYIDEKCTEYWSGTSLVLVGHHRISHDLPVPLRTITVARTPTGGFVVLHPHFSKYTRCVFAHHDAVENVFEQETKAAPLATFDEVADLVFRVCTYRRVQARRDFLKHETSKPNDPQAQGEDSTA